MAMLLRLWKLALNRFKKEHTGMTQRDDMGRELGGGVQGWELMYTCGGFMAMYECSFLFKNHISYFNDFFFFKSFF